MVDVSTARAALVELAQNHRWTWHGATRQLLESLPGEQGVHPATVVARLDDEAMATWLADEARSSALADLSADLEALVSRRAATRVAYFSPEYGLTDLLPQYSGGLGILAGDHTKSASDENIGLVAIGLFYRQGFFHQEIHDDRQGERYETVDPVGVGAVDTRTAVEVEIGSARVTARIWRIDVGATAMLLLDTDVEGNDPEFRSVTDRLYSGDRTHRLRQELVLGVGGVRALRSLGFEPGAFHLNEGHACFLLLELLAERIAAGATLGEAKQWVRDRTLFTTHTPVPAGIDRFDAGLIRRDLAVWPERLGVTMETLLRWGLLPDDGAPYPFNTAALCLRRCGAANGVSTLHGETSRELFSSMPSSGRIGSVTNGVHARTWVASGPAALFDSCLGEGWEGGDAGSWARAADIDDASIRAARAPGKQALVARVAAATGTDLDPEACIIGFARRFATYKRAHLVLREPERIEALLADDERPVQFVFAGKAHPADEPGKALLHEIVRFSHSAAARGRLTFLPDYDIGVALDMYAGCDVWLNNPRRPQEACGTSGEKSALNGGLNCSVLDGWWAEWFDASWGFAVPTFEYLDDLAERDAAEAAALMDLLTARVIPGFYDGGAHGPRWSAMVRAGWVGLGPRVTAGRMVREYDERYYRHLVEGDRLP